MSRPRRHRKSKELDLVLGASWRRRHCSFSNWVPPAASPRERMLLRHRQIKRLRAGGEPEVVDRLLGADQSLRDLFNLPGDGLGITAVDRQLGDRLDLRFQVLDLGLKLAGNSGGLFSRFASRDLPVSRLAWSD